MMQACDFLQVKAGFASFYFKLLSRFYLTLNQLPIVLLGYEHRRLQQMRTNNKGVGALL